MTDPYHGHLVHNPLACTSLATPGHDPGLGQQVQSVPSQASGASGVSYSASTSYQPIHEVHQVQYQAQHNPSMLSEGHGSFTGLGQNLPQTNLLSTQVKQEPVGNMVPERPRHRPGKRGRKPSHVDVKVKLERSRQSARECRARKKLRYQYLEELVASRERAIYALREELEMFKTHCKEIDEGLIPKEVAELAERMKAQKEMEASHQAATD